LFLVVALLSLIVTVATDCATYIPACLLTGSDPFTCWSNFVSNQQSQCTVAESITAFSICRAGGCPNCYFTCTPSTCLDALTIFTTCELCVNGSTSKSICDCYTDYAQNSASVCISNDEKLTQWSTCALAKLGCTTLNCPLDCQLLNSVIPDTRITFQACCNNTSTDKCSCYSAAVDKIVDFDACNTAVSLKLETCIQSQLDCTTLQGTSECKATDVTLTIAQIQQLYVSAADKFLSVWNTKLAALNSGITIDTATQVSDGNSITFTLSVTYSTNVNDAETKCISVFSESIGLSVSQMQATEVNTNKRGVLSTSTIQITGTQSGSSGASGLTFVLLPIVALISSIHYYF